MTAYPTASLRDVCAHVEYGYTASSTPNSSVGPRFLRITDIVPERLDWESVPFCAIEPKKLAKHRLRTGDIVIARTGATTGWAKYIKDPPEAVFASYLVRVRPASSVDARYIGFVVESSVYKDFIQQHMGGAAQPNANAQVLTSFEIPLPPLPIQRRIAGILSAYDELIENSQRRIKILESMARALYREWFVHFRFPGHESVPRVPSAIGEIPNGWEVKKLGDLCELRKDTYKDSDHSGLPLLDMARMPSRTLAPSDTGLPSELTTSRILFQKGDTLFGAIRCYLHKVVAAHYPGVTNTSVLVLRPRSASFRSLVAIVASDIDTIRWAETQSTGTKMPVINWGVFQVMPAPIPSKTLAQAFEDIAGPMLDEVGILATQIQNLRRTRDLLLPRLLSSQIDMEAIDHA